MTYKLFFCILNTLYHFWQTLVNFLVTCELGESFATTFFKFLISILIYMYHQVEVSPLEQPERIFVVEDDEVNVEKYISDEERQRLEELARLEEGKPLLIGFKRQLSGKANGKGIVVSSSLFFLV